MEMICCLLLVSVILICLVILVWFHFWQTHSLKKNETIINTYFGSLVWVYIIMNCVYTVSILVNIAK